jgi:hypothetical protein
MVHPVNEAYQTLKKPVRAGALPADETGHRCHGPEQYPDAGRLPDAPDGMARDPRTQSLPATWRRWIAWKPRPQTRSPRPSAKFADLLDERHDYPGAAEALRQYRFLEKFLADIGDAYEEIE